jgi:hypothetical protein
MSQIIFALWAAGRLGMKRSKFYVLLSEQMGVFLEPRNEVCAQKGF